MPRGTLEREYYAELCRVERWSVRTLRERIASQLYLRTAISKKPEAVIQAEISHLRSGGKTRSHAGWPTAQRSRLIGRVL